MARRKSYQQGTVVEVKGKRATVFRLRYRRRRPEGGWAEFTETLRRSISQQWIVRRSTPELGHSNVSTTGDIYVHTDDDQMDRNAEIIGKVLGGICGRSVVETGQEEGIVQ